MAQKIEGAQRDFSFGEVDIALKRSDDHPARKAGLRQMSNMRILNSSAIQNRPGRSALFPITSGLTRIEEFSIVPGSLFKIGFGAGVLQIINSAGTVVQAFTLQGGGGALPWTGANVGLIRYAILRLTLYICFPGMKPQMVTYDGVSAWSIADYAETVTSTGQKRTAFYRISPQNITLLPSAASGAINITFSAPVLVAGMIGARLSYIGRQILITGVTDSTHGTATVQEALPPGEILSCTTTGFTGAVGDVMIGSTTGARGILIQINVGSLLVQLIPSASGVLLSFGVETVVGPVYSIAITGVTTNQPPQAVSIWADEVFNAYRGYAASCFTDQFRLGFCNIPSVPGAIVWSAINLPTDLFAQDASSPGNAIFEIAPDKVQVYDVIPGAESSEFVICDGGLYYIAITAVNPLKPGSVSFQILSSDGCANVQPKRAGEIIVYVNAGANSMMAIIAPGNYYRPYNTVNLSEYASHLFNGVTTIALPTATGTFTERYAYVMNANGSIVCGKYTVKDGQVAGAIGWGPWSGAGAISWISAWNSDVLFTSSYFGVPICEILDDTQYLDAALPVNALPASFIPPGGKGPLWWIPSQTVSLMDQVTRSMGTYQIDANGFIVAQFNGGENLSIASLVAGQPWTATVEPFAADANPGPDVGQRMRRRRITKFAAYVVHSTGFLMARLFSSTQTRTSPALGTVMNTRRFTAWNQDDDPTKPPPSRETVETIRPMGRSYDPRAAIIKDTPGPLLIPELSMEITI